MKWAPRTSWRFPRTKEFLYTVSGGKIAGFRINASDGSLAPVNSVDSDGAYCYCHVDVSPDGRFIGAADYLAGLFDFYRLNTDGSIGDYIGRFDKFGNGPDKKRQEKPYGHAAYFIKTADNSMHALLVDLGSDRVSILDWDEASGKFVQNVAVPELKVPAGHGSRHLAYFENPDGSLDVFVNNELASTVTFFRVQLLKGKEKAENFGTWSTLPAEFDGKVSWDQDAVDADEKLILMNSTAETACIPGKNGAPTTVYVSNRGHNSIAIFHVAGANADTLVPVQFQPSGGNAPRYFAIDSTGRRMVVANKRSGSIYTFNIAADGTLSPTGLDPVWSPWAVAMVFVPKK